MVESPYQTTPADREAFRRSAPKLPNSAEQLIDGIFQSDIDLIANHSQTERYTPFLKRFFH